MTLGSSAYFTRQRNSSTAGKAAAQHLLSEVEGAPRVVLAYQTVSHDQAALLEALAGELPADTHIVGCSAQGVMGRGEVRESGYAATFLALGGEGVHSSRGVVERIAQDSFEKGKNLGKQLLEGLNAPPRVVILHFDPLAGADMNRFLAGLDQVVACPLVGGGSAHHFGVEMTTTHQYAGTSVLSHAAVATAVSGDFEIQMVSSQGCSPVGAQLLVTKSSGSRVLELDGRPAADVWTEVCGARGEHDVLSTTAVAVGVPNDSGGEELRAVFLIDKEDKGFVLHAPVEEGATVTLHHRTVEDVLNGSRAMARELAAAVSGKQLKAVLGFECGARTSPFLGIEETRAENREIQEIVGLSAQWAGASLWGEICPAGNRPGLHNYTYPLLALLA